MAKQEREELEAKLTEEVTASLVPLQEEMDKLATIPEVVKYLSISKQFRDQEKVLKKNIQTQMEDHGIKSIKGTWGYMTIVERSNYKAVNIDEVPSKFIKKTLDTSKVAAHLKLTNKLPAGVETDPSQSLTISLKPREAKE